jgi:hypothetical protein
MNCLAPIWCLRALGRFQMRLPRLERPNGTSSCCTGRLLHPGFRKIPKIWAKRVLIQGLLLGWLFCVPHAPCVAQEVVGEKVVVQGRKLLVGGRPYVIKGICYHPVPLGSTQRSFDQLDKDLALMRESGINTLRVYAPIVEGAVLDRIAAQGLKVIMGFGYDQEGKFDIKSGTYLEYVKTYRNHKAILMWELGNEYNYHPEWFGGSIEYWYRAMNAAAERIKALDDTRPVATAHGELPDSRALALAPEIEVWGMNVYRWDDPSAIFKEWEALSDKPMYLSEAGADSYMAISKGRFGQGDNQRAQAHATKKILKKVFKYGDVCLGVALFQFIDGWWKAGNPHVQDVGGWAPNSSGVPYDGAPNEEYWGILDIHRNKKSSFHTVQKAYGKH